MAVFGSAERLASWVGICPSHHESAGKRKSGKTRKGHQKSIVALAHKRLRIIYAMFKNYTHYQDRAPDYEALIVQRNAPRWIKMLVKHGIITPATA